MLENVVSYGHCMTSTRFSQVLFEQAIFNECDKCENGFFFHLMLPATLAGEQHEKKQTVKTLSIMFAIESCSIYTLDLECASVGSHYNRNVG